jgi:cyclopropane-fatty-acyl-phospholipid synthase
LEADGDIFGVLRALQDAARPNLRAGPRPAILALRAALQLGVLGRPPAPPAVEASPHGRRHSKSRDAAVISHHYDISNEFYRLILGPSMTYSCARFVEASTTLEAAQQSKHDLVCRKLGLHEHRGARLLDVGCGWGSLVLHAARHYGANVVGITLSTAQADLARTGVKEAGLDDQIEIRVQDYRDLRDERFDAISSIGMFEHVGTERTGEYFATLHALLSDTGRLLNHAISSVGGSRMARNSFIGRYVFPDGELIDVGQVVLAMERAGFEVRDVESLREHYARTLRAGVRN